MSSSTSTILIILNAINAALIVIWNYLKGGAE